MELSVIVARMTEVRYSDGDVELRGELYESGGPGLLLIHGGAGLDAHARDQARRYADLGYTVFACDMYGVAAIGDRTRIMQAVIGMRDDPDLLVRRAKAGLAVLATVADRHAAIGFCFGGMAALTLARAGVPIEAAISVHGTLETKATTGPVTAKILVCHGALDPHVPMAQVNAFSEEMTSAGADWQLILYGGAQHGFTHRDAIAGVTPGVAYDERADARSFAAITQFLSETMTVSTR
jgi:dienelactone hydrolase